MRSLKASPKEICTSGPPPVRAPRPSCRPPEGRGLFGVVAREKGAAQGDRFELNPLVVHEASISRTD